jgi:hypothetical protein
MDGFKEKKWFVYLGDHHEGPFSLEEIQTKISQGQLSGTNYVWAEGMGDWKMMSEVEVFDSILRPALNPSSSPASVSMPPDLAPQSEPSVVIESVRLEAASPAFSMALEGAFSESVIGGSPSITERTKANHFTGKGPKTSAVIKSAAILAILGGLFLAYASGLLGPKTGSQSLTSSLDPLLQALSDKVPMLGQWISPIPTLQDVDKDEFESLKASARANLDTAGPQLGIALSRNDALNPTFYLSSNLPNGAIFDVYVEGIPETLLNQLTFSAKGQVVINKKLGQTASLKGLDGKAFPRGEYTIYVVDPETQPAQVRPFMSRMQTVTPQVVSANVPKGLRIVATKSYFLGGEKDASYTTRLKEFHDKLSAKAQAELAECTQFAATLDMQLTSTISKFTALRRGNAKRISLPQKKAWAAFDKQWSQLMNQLGQSLSKITPDSLKNDYFYGTLYQASQQTSQAVSHLHEIQNTVFAKNADPKNTEIQIGESVGIAQTAVNELKAKIDFITKLPPKPNGMPNRDGI